MRRSARQPAAEIVARSRRQDFGRQVHAHEVQLPESYGSVELPALAVLRLAQCRRNGPDASGVERTFEASRRANSGISPRDIEVVTVSDTPVVALSVTGDSGVSVPVFVTEACRKPPLAFCFSRRARPKTPARKSTSRRPCLAKASASSIDLIRRHSCVPSPGAPFTFRYVRR
jgi:hypothetical protein